MQINYYYDETEHRRHATDGSLVQLCAGCAADINEIARRNGQAAEVALAGRGDEDSICEHCAVDQHGRFTA